MPWLRRGKLEAAIDLEETPTPAAPETGAELLSLGSMIVLRTILPRVVNFTSPVGGT
jgi:hypothetical protein